ncbi:uncharacterized protein TNCV_1781531 [Trichonephila clavipes]|nr:uncharacterized protein TNCV_1781531 [Trichonephila clavipes]
MSVIVNESNISKQLSEFWNVENLGIEAEVSDEENIDNDMSEFEAGISYQNKRYKVKFPWKPNMKTLLENNEEIARKRFLKLRSRLKNDSSLFEDCKLVVNNYLSEKIIERVPFEEENLKHNIFYLPHRAVIRTDKTTSKLRIVFNASSHAKSQLSLNDCLHTGLNFIPNLFFLLIKFRVNPIEFVADIKMAFLMIEIDESERDFTRFFWDENPGIDLENKRLDIFRMTRVLFGVKSSPFLLAATIKHHLKKYADIFPDTFNHLNQSLYVDDFLCGNDSVQAALTTCIESKQILEDATSKALGVGWNEKSDAFYFDSSDLGTFLSKRINTKRYLLQAAGRLFDPVGFIGPYTIRIKCLIQEIWCLGLDWDDKLPKQLEVSWNKWCNEIHYLSEIKIPRYYFQNFLPSNATTIQLHCFSDASKKAYGTVAYLRIELNNGNIISSFVASKGRVAPLKTLSIPRLELMGALLSARLSDKIATALTLPVSRFYWTDSSIACYWIKRDFNRHKVFVKNRVKEIQKLSDPKEWRYCKGKDNPADLISRGLPLNDLKNKRIWWHGPKWLTMKQTEWPLFSEPIIETEINNDKLELKKSINVNTAVEKRQIENNLISRYSSFSKLIRISALCLRFIYNCKVNPVLRKIDCISASESDHVTKVLVKQVQLNEFLTEIKCLKNGQPIPKGSKISSLNVFLDEDEILRVGGRLKHSTLSEFQKHQMMLPKAHHLTDLIID